MSRYDPEKYYKHFLLGSTVLTSLLVIPFINGWWVWMGSDYPPNPAELAEAQRLIWYFIPAITLCCYLVMFKLFSANKLGFLLISLAGFTSAIFVVIIFEQCFASFFVPFERTNFTRVLGFSLGIGNVISLVLMWLFRKASTIIAWLFTPSLP